MRWLLACSLKIPAMLRVGEKQGKSLLGADEPSLWYEAAAALPPLEASVQQPLSQDEVEERRLAAEDAMDGEAAAFEKAFGELLALPPCNLRPLPTVSISVPSAWDAALQTALAQGILRYRSVPSRHRPRQQPTQCLIMMSVAPCPVHPEQLMCQRLACFAGRRNGQDMKWLQEVRRMGTTADKVAALTLLLQESAISNLRSLDELLRWVSKRSGARAVAGQVRTKRSLLLRQAAAVAPKA